MSSSDSLRLYRQKSAGFPWIIFVNSFWHIHDVCWLMYGAFRKHQYYLLWISFVLPLTVKSNLVRDSFLENGRDWYRSVSMWVSCLVSCTWSISELSSGSWLSVNDDITENNRELRHFSRIYCLVHTKSSTFISNRLAKFLFMITLQSQYQIEEKKTVWMIFVCLERLHVLHWIFWVE